MSSESLNSLMKTDPMVGLSSIDAQIFLQKFGANELPTQKTHLLFDFFKKFWGPSAWILELILAISFSLKKYDDVTVVTILLVINAVLSFFLEKRASSIVQTLKERLQIRVRVLRDAIWVIIPAKEIVPGDIIRIRAGDFVPADLVIIEGEVEVDQSALTGESVDIHFKQGDKLISGSIVRRGEAKAIVELTGAETQYGKTAILIDRASPKLHIEQVVIKIVTWLFVIVFSMMCAVIFLAALRHTPLDETAPILLILLMSAIPISLPVMFTVCLSIGARDLSRQGVLVTRLSAVEDAATMDQLCVDKTGTITLNQLSIVSITALGDQSEDDIILAGAMAAEEANQDPIDLAFIREAHKRFSFFNKKIYETILFVPFDPSTRSTKAIVKLNGHERCVMKGAVSSVISGCAINTFERERIILLADELAKKGYRILAVAQGPVLTELLPVGLVALFDPPRPDASDFVQQIKNLGVSLKMLTGDALVVANELSARVGLGIILPFSQLKNKIQMETGQSEKIRNEDINNEQINKDNLIINADGFAEVYPEDKFRVVKFLQSLGHITGMTGDGVNDGPALRQAEVGIAVSGSTDVARGAASIVLTEPGLNKIIYLIMQGRVVYQRLLTWVINKVSRTILKALYVAIAYVITGKFVVSAFAMLLLVLITDATKISLATDRVRPSNHPETWQINGYIGIAAVLGLVMLVEALLLLWFGWNYLGLSTNDSALNTFSFLSLLYFAAFSILSVRERRHFWSSKPGLILWSSFVFEITIGTLLATHGLRSMASLPWALILGIFFYAMATCLFVNDWIKFVLVKQLHQIPECQHQN